MHIISVIETSIYNYPSLSSSVSTGCTRIHTAAAAAAAASVLLVSQYLVFLKWVQFLPLPSHIVCPYSFITPFICPVLFVSLSLVWLTRDHNRVL